MESPQRECTSLATTMEDVVLHIRGTDYFRRTRHITAKAHTLFQWEREGYKLQASECLLDAVFVCEA